MADPNKEGPWALLSGKDMTQRNNTVSSPKYTGRFMLPWAMAKLVTLNTAAGSAFFNAAWVFMYGLACLSKQGTAQAASLTEILLSKVSREMSERAESPPGGLDPARTRETTRSLVGNMGEKIVDAAYKINSGLDALLTVLSSSGTFVTGTLHLTNQLFGSTDASRALSAILAMLQNELKSVTAPGEKSVGTCDVLRSISVFAYLQSKCYNIPEERMIRESLEEGVWDIVIRRDGERADVEGLRFESHGMVGNMNLDMDPTRPPEEHIKAQVARSLQSQGQVEIFTETTVSKTITVKVRGTDSIPFEPPRGATIVEESFNTLENEEGAAYQVTYMYEKTASSTSQIAGAEASQIVDPRPKTLAIEQASDTGANITPASIIECENTIQDVPRHPVFQIMGPVSLENCGPDSVCRTESPPESPLDSLGRSTEAGEQQNVTDIISRATRTAPSSPTLNEEEREIQPKKMGLRKALKRSTTSALSGILNRENSKTKSLVPSPSLPRRKSSTDMPQLHDNLPKSRLPIPTRASSAIHSASARTPSYWSPGLALTPMGQRDNHPYQYQHHADISRCSSRASLVSIHDTRKETIISQADNLREPRRDSLISYTESYSLVSQDDLRPVSPTFLRRDVVEQSTRISDVRETEGALRITESDDNDSPATQRAAIDTTRERPEEKQSSFTQDLKGFGHRAMGSTTSASLVLWPNPANTFQDPCSVEIMRARGYFEGMYPPNHFLRNIARYMKFASATYGTYFLRALGISHSQVEKFTETMGFESNNKTTFCRHTKIPNEKLILASFEDSHGAISNKGLHDTPLVHYIAVDDDSKAVVLSCRGTLDFEDILTDLLCDYYDFKWQGNTYQVHQGIHASARRILYGQDGKVLRTLQKTLLEHEGYGLVLCGHSLGGAVTALLGVMLSEPSADGRGFVTSAEPHNAIENKHHACIPGGRPIHVYAYGPPGVVSPELQKQTSKLITTVVTESDWVPHLSLGVLHDLASIAHTFTHKTDSTGISPFRDIVVEPVLRRISAFARSAIEEEKYSQRDEESGETSMVAMLHTLRSGMTNSKLIPPGEVFVVDTRDCLRRDAFVQQSGQPIFHGTPATRIELRRVKDVLRRFGEIRFNNEMFTAHSPSKYEHALDGLCIAILGR